MVFAGFYDALAIGSAIKLLIFSLAASVSDAWHPAFFAAKPSGSLVAIMALLLIGLMLATFNACFVCFAVLYTESVRLAGLFLSGASGFCYFLVLILFTHSLAAITSPWLLAILTCSLDVHLSHVVLIYLKRLEPCPILHAAQTSILFLISVLCICIPHWWIAGPASALDFSLAHSVSLYGIPSTAAGVAVQIFVTLTMITLLLMALLNCAMLAVSRGFVLTSLPLSDTIVDLVNIGLASAALLFSVLAACMYYSFTYHTNSMLAAVCLTNAVLSLFYQLLCNGTIPTV